MSRELAHQLSREGLRSRDVHGNRPVIASTERMANTRHKNRMIVLRCRRVLPQDCRAATAFFSVGVLAVLVGFGDLSVRSPSKKNAFRIRAFDCKGLRNSGLRVALRDAFGA